MRSGKAKGIRKKAPVCLNSVDFCILTSAPRRYRTAKRLRSSSSVDRVLMDRIARVMHTNTVATYKVPMISVPALALRHRRYSSRIAKSHFASGP